MNEKELAALIDSVLSRALEEQHVGWTARMDQLVAQISAGQGEAATLWIAFTSLAGSADEAARRDATATLDVAMENWPVPATRREDVAQRIRAMLRVEKKD